MAELSWDSIIRFSPSIFFTDWIEFFDIKLLETHYRSLLYHLRNNDGTRFCSWICKNGGPIKGRVTYNFAIQLRRFFPLWVGSFLNLNFIWPQVAEFTCRNGLLFSVYITLI